MSDADVTDDDHTRGTDIHAARIVAYSLVPWPTHEDGSPYTDAEAAAYGVHKVTVGDGRYMGGSTVMEAAGE